MDLWLFMARMTWWTGKGKRGERKGEGDKIDRDGGNTESTGEFLLPWDGERESFNVWI